MPGDPPWPAAVLHPNSSQQWSRDTITRHPANVGRHTLAGWLAGWVGGCGCVRACIDGCRPCVCPLVLPITADIFCMTLVEENAQWMSKVVKKTNICSTLAAGRWR